MPLLTDRPVLALASLAVVSPPPSVALPPEDVAELAFDTLPPVAPPLTLASPPVLAEPLALAAELVAFVLSAMLCETLLVTPCVTLLVTPALDELFVTLPESHAPGASH
jgi:hypothetical protein